MFEIRLLTSRLRSLYPKIILVNTVLTMHEEAVRASSITLCVCVCVACAYMCSQESQPFELLSVYSIVDVRDAHSIRGKERRIEWSICYRSMNLDGVTVARKLLMFRCYTSIEGTTMLTPNRFGG